MQETYSKSRQQAEIDFGAAQSQFFARGHAAEELQSIATLRDEKTLRLRAARLASELSKGAEDTKPASAKKRAKSR